MLLIAFLSLLVFSTYSSPLIINRITLILLFISLFLFNSSYTLFSINDGLALFNDWFILSNSNLFFINIIFISIIILFIYNSFNLADNLYLSLIIIANTIGLILFPLVNDILSLYILIELQSYSLYILTGINNKSYNASRAALLYFLMGGIASCLILLSSYYI